MSNLEQPRQQEVKVEGLPDEVRTGLEMIAGEGEGVIRSGTEVKIYFVTGEIKRMVEDLRGNIKSRDFYNQTLEELVDIVRGQLGSGSKSTIFKEFERDAQDAISEKYGG